MTRFTLILIAAAFCIGQLTAADDDAKAIVRKAIEAHGGATLLSKYPAAKVKSKGRMQLLPGQMVPFESTATYQMPDKMKQVMTVQLGGASQSVTILQIGDKPRMFRDGNEMKVEEKELPKYRQTLYVQNLYQLTPLLNENVCKLSLIDDNNVFERPARGVRASAKGQNDIAFYFDKGTNMLVKTQRTGYDIQGNEAPMEEFFSVYKDIKGYMYPTKTNVLVRGKKFIESEVIEFLPLEKFEAAEFEKP